MIKELTPQTAPETGITPDGKKITYLQPDAAKEASDMEFSNQIWNMQRRQAKHGEVVILHPLAGCGRGTFSGGTVLRKKPAP